MTCYRLVQALKIMLFNPPPHKEINSFKGSGPLKNPLSAYIELVDWTGRIIRNDKRGFIDPALPDILDRLDIDTKRWVSSATQFEAIHTKRFSNRPRRINTS